ncbi:MAG: hypothetical protein E7651_05990 [Ruminococcaceae bacterium]|nr:hypothetical protein [Oscillospiraceae bacterium]
MKRSITEQLTDYILQTGTPDEKILTVEKKQKRASDYVGSIILVVTLALVFFMLYWVMPMFIYLPMVAIIAIVVPGFYLPMLLLNRRYLVITDRAVYLCVGALAADVFSWTYSEISHVEFNGSAVTVTSTHQQNEVGFSTEKITKHDWKNMFSYMKGNPIKFQHFSLTRYFVRPATEEAYVYSQLSDGTRYLFIRFTCQPETKIRDAFAQVTKRHKRVKIGTERNPLE